MKDRYSPSFFSLPDRSEGGKASSSNDESISGRDVYIIDAHGMIYQVYHALPEMSSPQGEPAGAVFGFTRDLISLLEKRRPEYLFCAFDMPGKTFRHEMFEPYKANRGKMPEDLPSQIDAIRQLLYALRIPAVGAETFEADDVMATMARKIEAEGGNCFLVTSDKDCRQLITDQIQIYRPRKQVVYGKKDLEEDWGIRPEQVVDYQALVGDTSDNIPGVPLIGPKIARELLQKYGTLEKILDNADEISGKKRKENLKNGRKDALVSRELVSLRDDVPLDIEWSAGKMDGVDVARLRGFFRRFGFRKLSESVDALEEHYGHVSTMTMMPLDAREMPIAGAPEPDRTPKDDSEKNGTATTDDGRGHAYSLFDLQEDDEAPEVPGVSAEYRLVENQQQWEDFFEKLKKQTAFSVDLETTSKHPRFAEIVGIAFCWSEQEAWYLPLQGPEGYEVLDADMVWKALRPILEDPDIEKIGQNLKYDMIVLRRVGIRLAGLTFDTMVADYLLHAGQRSHNLDELARHYLDHTTTKISELIGKGKKQKRMDEIPTDRVGHYAAEDALIPWLLRPILQHLLEKQELVPLFEELELPLVEVLVALEYHGIGVDIDRLSAMSRRHEKRLKELEAEIHSIAGEEFNIASPKQLQKILFERFELPVIKKTKTGPSTDVEVLQELAPRHPIPAKVIEYRQGAKLKGTYLDALPELVHPETGRIHTSLNQVVTATGRLSSSDPNLQNIPVRTTEGREIRSAFVAQEPYDLLLAADYSQVELRVLAHFSEDSQLCRAFEEDEDIHRRVAGEVYGVKLEEVTSEMRRQAKAVNFGVIYGQSAFGLARQLGIFQDEAAEFIDAYFEGYPRIREFLDEVLDECCRRGYVKTISGRRRSIVGVRRERPRQLNLAERTAINTVIQGSAADLIKQAMVAVYRRLEKERPDGRMLLQIHDELVFEVTREDRDALAEMVVEEMVLEQPLRVPLKIDVKAGENWADAEPWSE
jgi:DNA polymerase-1